MSIKAKKNNNNYHRRELPETSKIYNSPHSPHMELRYQLSVDCTVSGERNGKPAYCILLRLKLLSFTSNVLISIIAMLLLYSVPHSDLGYFLTYSLWCKIWPIPQSSTLDSLIFCAHATPGVDPSSIELILNTAYHKAISHRGYRCHVTQDTNSLVL